MTLSEPLRFAPLYFEKVWGGRALEPFLGHPLAIDGQVGEVWELVDRDGAGSVVADGPLEGRSLRGLMLSEGEGLLGDARPAEGGYFPVLIKFLDARQNLSVQVHPDAKAAARLGGGAAGKTECWYVLSADPGSVLYLGFRPDVDSAAIAEQATTPEVIDLLQAHPVEAGQFFFVPAGTVHAIGAGITLVEIQENSDTTYRLFDWGRVGLDGKPREVHREEALRSIDYEQVLAGPSQTEPSGGSGARTALADCEAFSVELLDVGEALRQDTRGRAVAYVGLEGSGRLAGRVIERGQTWLVPADAGVHQIEPGGRGPLRLLKVETKA